MASSDESIDQTIGRLVLNAPENYLADFKNLPIFETPLVGIADGDDEIFELFRKVVSLRHISPRAILERYKAPAIEVSTIRVVSWALPFSAEIRRSNRLSEWPSELYSVARNNGGALNYEMSRRLTSLLRKNGYAAVSPMLTEEYDAFCSSEYAFSSSWSERHVAYAAGLGSFGLNGCLITSRGAMVRLGSLVTNAPLRTSSKRETDYRSPCLRNGGDDCGLCLEKCPCQAISHAGLDKTKCYARRQTIRERSIDLYTRKFHMLPAPIVKGGKKSTGFSLGCALCVSGVPCEGSDSLRGKKG